MSEHLPHLPATSNLSSYQQHVPQLGNGVFVHPRATVIGQVTLDNHVSIWPHSVVRGDVHKIRIGEGTNIQDMCTLHVSHQSPWDPAGAPLVIGAHVTVGHQVILHGCTLEDQCLIGMGSIVMDKAVVQKQVLLGAGSLVSEGQVLESGYLYFGRPARRVRPLTEAELAHFEYSAQHYIRLKNQYLGCV